jgi:hypothetical protein
MADLVTRREWGARAPRGSYTKVSAAPRGVKIHYTGGRVDPRTLTDHDRCVAAVRGIQGGHMDGNGWMDIGYSAVACPHRKVFVARGPGNVPAANGPGLNSAHYAVLVLVGSSGVTEPTDGHLLAALDAIEWLRREGSAGGEVKGHRDGYATSCPGDPLYAWIRRGCPRPGGTEAKPAAAAKPAARPSSAPAWPGRILCYPPLTSGSDVRAWQQQMKARGWRIGVDGTYGPQSREICKRFQAEKGLLADGIVGPKTWKATWETPVT